MTSITARFSFFFYLLRIGGCFKTIYNEEITSYYDGKNVIPFDIEYGDNILLYTLNGTYEMNDINDAPFLSSTSLDYIPINKYSSGRNEVEFFGNVAFLHIKGKHYYKIITEDSYFIYKMDYNPYKRLAYFLSGPTMEYYGGFVYFLDVRNPSVCNDTVKTKKLKMSINSTAIVNVFAVNKDTGDLVLFFENFTRIALMQNDTRYKTKTTVISSQCRQDQISSSGTVTGIKPTISVIDRIVQLHDKGLNFIYQLYASTRNMFVRYKRRCDNILKVEDDASTIPQNVNINDNIDEFKMDLVNFLEEQNANASSSEFNSRKCRILEHTVALLENRLRTINDRLLFGTQTRVSGDEDDGLPDFVTPGEAALSPYTRNVYVCLRKVILEEFRSSITKINDTNNNNTGYFY